MRSTTASDQQPMGRRSAPLEGYGSELCLRVFPRRCSACSRASSGLASLSELSPVAPGTSTSSVRCWRPPLPGRGSPLLGRLLSAIVTSYLLPSNLRLYFDVSSGTHSDE